MNQEQAAPVLTKKSTKIYIVLIVMPLVLLLIVSALAVITQFAFNSSAVQTTSQSIAECGPLENNANLVDGNCVPTDSVQTPVAEIVVKIIQLILGVVSVILLMLEPLWIILLIATINHNSKVGVAVEQLPDTSTGGGV